MDTKTLNFNFGDGDVEKLKEVLRRMGEFIAYFEVAEERMAEWKRNIETTLQQHNDYITHQIHEIHETTDELRNVMTEAGVARWRIAAEASLQHGKEHIKILENLCKNHLDSLAINHDEFSKLSKKSFDRLDRASAYTIKNISEAVSSFRISDFQKLTEQTCELVEETSSTAISRLKDTVKWFHWKNLGLAFGITIFASLSIGLYLNDEMPWEIHKTVVAQRNAGQALLNAWPTLSREEQQRIIENSKTNRDIT